MGIKSCESLGEEASDHFVEITDMILVDKGAKRLRKACEENGEAISDHLVRSYKAIGGAKAYEENGEAISDHFV